MHILILGTINFVYEDKYDTDPPSVLVHIEDLDVGAGSGSTIGDTTMAVGGFLGVGGLCVWYLVVVTDVDCATLVQLTSSMIIQTYCQDVLVQYCGDPKGGEHRKPA